MLEASVYVSPLHAATTRMSPTNIVKLDPAHLVDAAHVLASACLYDRANEVAAEKLFGAGPSGQPQAFGAWDGARLVGVAAVAQQWIRVVAVVPEARQAGIGGALLTTCERVARAEGHTRLRTLDQPGNYLAPGIDERNIETIEWLCRRGWRRDGEPRRNAVIAVRDNPRVTSARLAMLTETARAKGYEIRRAWRGESALLDAIRTMFGGAWPFEVEQALGADSPGVYVALANGIYSAFAAHDGNNRGLGWFGPAGTWPEHRGKGLGEVVLLSCLLDIAHDHDRCEVAWIGPRAFYDNVAGIIADRTFVALVKDLPT